MSERAPWKPYKPEPFARIRGLRVLIRDWLWLRRVGRRTEALRAIDPARCPRCGNPPDVCLCEDPENADSPHRRARRDPSPRDAVRRHPLPECHPRAEESA